MQPHVRTVLHPLRRPRRALLRRLGAELGNGRPQQAVGKRRLERRKIPQLPPKLPRRQYQEHTMRRLLARGVILVAIFFIISSNLFK